MGRWKMFFIVKKKNDIRKHIDKLLYVYFKPKNLLCMTKITLYHVPVRLKSGENKLVTIIRKYIFEGYSDRKNTFEKNTR